MRDGWPSLTALGVAIARGIGTSSEPTSITMVPPPLHHGLTWLHRSPNTKGIRSALRLMSGGMVDHVCLRRAAIDDALHTATAAGVSQLVILGAGLDDRAWRLPTLKSTIVFEVDTPATQANKRRWAARYPPQAKALHYVAVDFERDPLQERLIAAHHDPTGPTVWIWEGVTPYLYPEAIERTLAAVSARSARGSTLLMTYAVPSLIGNDLPGLRSIIHAGFAGIGEPLRGMIEPDALVRMLARHGFKLRDDSGNRQWATRYAGNAVLARMFATERLALAEPHDQ